MNRPPRNLKEPLFNRRAIVVSLLQGLGVLIAIFALFWFVLWFGRSEEEARAITFTAIVFANIMLIISNLSWSKLSVAVLGEGNKALYWILGFVSVALALVLFVPFLRQVFHFAPIGLFDILLAFAAAAISLLWFEIFKFFKKP
jgi:Ca2+-transporting ATPase